MPSSCRALLYQHRTAERDRLIAAMMSEITEAELADPDNPSGTQRARKAPGCVLIEMATTVITALTCGF